MRFLMVFTRQLHGDFRCTHAATYQPEYLRTPDPSDLPAPTWLALLLPPSHVVEQHRLEADRANRRLRQESLRIATMTFSVASRLTRYPLAPHSPKALAMHHFVVHGHTSVGRYGQSCWTFFDQGQFRKAPSEKCP